MIKESLFLVDNKKIRNCAIGGLREIFDNV